MKQPVISTPNNLSSLTNERRSPISSFSFFLKFSAFLIVVLILLAVDGFFFSKSLQQKIPLSPNPKKASPGTPTLSFPASTISSANWKTYRNKKYQYLIKYPSNWFVTEAIDPKIGNSDGKEVAFASFDQNEQEWPTSRAKVKISILENPQKLGGEEWYRAWQKDSKGDIQILGEEKLVISGTEGFKFITEHPRDRNGSIYIIYLPRGNQMYQFWVGGNKEYLSTLKNILSTFKFLD